MLPPCAGPLYHLDPAGRQGEHERGTCASPKSWSSVDNMSPLFHLTGWNQYQGEADQLCAQEEEPEVWWRAGINATHNLFLGRMATLKSICCSEAYCCFQRWTEDKSGLHGNFQNASSLSWNCGGAVNRASKDWVQLHHAFHPNFKRRP